MSDFGPKFAEFEKIEGPERFDDLEGFVRILGIRKWFFWWG